MVLVNARNKWLEAGVVMPFCLLFAVMLSYVYSRGTPSLWRLTYFVSFNLYEDLSFLTLKKKKPNVWLQTALCKP